MKSDKQWQLRHRPIAMSKHFTPRIKKDLMMLDIQIPDIDINFEKGQGLYLFGATSTGKTLLAAEMLLEQKRQAYLKGGEALEREFEFKSMPVLLFEIKQTYSQDKNKSEEDIIQRYSQDVWFLVLDDFGVVSKSSEWVLNILYLIINGRYENCLPTIITSNIDLDEVVELFDARIASRLKRMCKVMSKKPWDDK